MTAVLMPGALSLKYKTDANTVNRHRKIAISVSKKGGLVSFSGKIIIEDIKTVIHKRTPYNINLPAALIEMLTFKNRGHSRCGYILLRYWMDGG